MYECESWTVKKTDKKKIDLKQGVGGDLFGTLDHQEDAQVGPRAN